MIHVITGAPCSGKSTYVKEHAKDGDLRVDYDAIAMALGAMNIHAAEGLVKQAAFDAREGAIRTALNDPDAESWIIHTSPSEEHMKMYEEAGAEFIPLDPGFDECMERATRDGRPQQSIDGIRKWYGKGQKMEVKTKTFDVKADNGTITGYASTWIREPDSYGDIVAKGAFTESIANIKAAGKVLPLLYNHDNEELKNFIGKVTELEEDDHGLKFTATFDSTPEAQRARELAMDGRLAKFSFAYDVIDEDEVTLEDGRKANELRKLNIHEVSLVLYPANPDTSVVSVKGAEDASIKAEPNKTVMGVIQISLDDEAKELIKSGRRNSAKDAEDLRHAITLIQGVLGELDDTPAEEEAKAKSEEPDTVNDEEQLRNELLEKARNILNGGNEK